MKFLSTAAPALLLFQLGASPVSVSAQVNVPQAPQVNAPSVGPNDPGKDLPRPGEPRQERQYGHRRREQPQAKPARHDQHPQHPARSKQQAREWQERRGWEGQGGWRGHGDWHGARAGHWQAEHRTWGERGGYGGYFIPHRRFTVYFGPQHVFRIRTRPVVYMGYPRFYYEGYSFVMVDPYPEDWDEDWYASDDVYIEYDDGYYLYNRRHPGVALSVMVVR